jgi:chloramphenicol 3-O-phosphotransferase
LKGLKEIIDATDGKGMLNFLMQFTAALCYLHYGIGSYMEAATSDAGQASGWETVVHTDVRPDQVFLQTPPHERFPCRQAW